MRAPLSVGNLPQKNSCFSHGLPSLKQKQQVHENRARQKKETKQVFQPSIFQVLLLMEEILHQLIGTEFFLISGGYLGFLPSAIS